MPGPAVEQALVRRLRSARASRARMVHRAPAMDSLMMGLAVVKASHVGRAGKSIGRKSCGTRDADYSRDGNRDDNAKRHGQSSLLCFITKPKLAAWYLIYVK